MLLDVLTNGDLSPISLGHFERRKPIGTHNLVRHSIGRGKSEKVLLTDCGRGS